MLIESPHLSHEKALPVLFIGSMICPDGSKKSILEYAINQARTKDGIHLPQTPQRGAKGRFNRWSMDGEALHSGSPFFITPEGKIAYDLVVSPDKGVEPGIIINRKGTQENLDTLELAVAELIHSTKKEGYDAENVNKKLNKLISLYSLPSRDSFSSQLPDGLKELIKYLEHNPDNIPDVIKLQISGPMNTAQNLWAYNEKGELEQGLVAQNQRLLSIHAGLIFARSLFWTRAVEKALSKSGKKPEIVFSFDEPNFEQLDKELGPRLATSLDVYSQLWGPDANLPYKRMIHVCGSFVPEMLEYVDYINFDVWNKGDLVVGHEKEIKAFMERGGKIVAGIVPTNLSDLQTYFGQRGQEIKELNEVTGNSMMKWALLEECYRRVGNLVSKLSPPIALETILDHLVISPQCGLGGLVPYSRPQAVEYTGMIYEMTQQVAQEMVKHQRFA